MLKYIPEREGASCLLNSERSFIYAIEYGDVSKCEITTPKPKFRRYIGEDIVFMGDLLSTDEVYLTEFGYISEGVRAWCCIILSEDHPGKGIILKYPAVAGRNAEWVESVVDEKMHEIENETKNTSELVPAEGSRASFLRYVWSSKGYSIEPRSYRLRWYKGSEQLLIGQTYLKNGDHMYTKLATTVEDGKKWHCVFIGLQTLGPWAVLYYDDPEKLAEDWTLSFLRCSGTGIRLDAIDENEKDLNLSFKPIFFPSDSNQVDEDKKDVETTELPEEDDMVENPNHYVKNGVECINWIRQALTPEEFRGYLKGNVLKYIWRCEDKGAPVRDVRKGGKYCRFLEDELASNWKADDNE